MTYILLLFLVILNFICLYRKKKNIYVLHYSIITFTLILGGNNYSADFWAYEENYELIQTDDSYFGFDFLWGPLMRIGGYLGLNYNEYLLCLSFVAYNLLFMFLYKRHNYNIHKIILLYVIYSFFIDAIQVANFFANVLAIIAIYMYFNYKEEKRKKHLFITIFFLFLGVGLHSSISILFLLVFFKKTYRIKYLVLLSVIFSFVDTLWGHIILDRIMSVLPVGDIYMSLKEYGEARNKGFGFIIYLSILWLMLVMVKKNVESYNAGKRNGLYTNSNIIKYNDNVIFFLRYIFIMSPVFAISTITYVRILRIVMIFYSDFYATMSRTNREMVHISNALLVTIYFYFFYTDVGIDNLLDIMNNNYLFGQIK